MFITVPVLVLWYTAHAVLSRFAGTCNNGDTGRFVVGLIVGVPAGTIAALLLLLAPASRGWRIGVVLATTPFAFVSLCLWVLLAISAGIHGHHLCGPEFDTSVAAGDEWERVYRSRTLPSAPCSSSARS